MKCPYCHRRFDIVYGDSATDDPLGYIVRYPEKVKSATDSDD